MNSDALEGKAVPVPHVATHHNLAEQLLKETVTTNNLIQPTFQPEHDPFKISISQDIFNRMSE